MYISQGLEICFTRVGGIFYKSQRTPTQVSGYDSRISHRQKSFSSYLVARVKLSDPGIPLRGFLVILDENSKIFKIKKIT